MRSLIAAEVYKLYKQSRTYYALAAIFVLELIILVSAYYQGDEILDILLDNLKQTFYFQGTLLNGNLMVYLILNTLWFNLPLILMVVISGLITSEYKDRTLEAMMLHPVSRKQFIWSKYAVSIGFTVLVVLLMAISAFGLSYLFFGKGDLIVYLGQLNFFESKDAFRRLVGAFASGTVSMVFFSVVSLTLGVIFREPTKTWIVAALFLILSNLLLKVDFGTIWLNKLFFPKLGDTWQYFFNNKILWDQILFNNGLLLGYTLLIAGLGSYIFIKRDVG